MKMVYRLLKVFFAAMTLAAIAASLAVAGEIFLGKSGCTALLDQLPETFKSNELLKTDLLVLIKSYHGSLAGLEFSDQGDLRLIMRNNDRILYDDGRQKDFEGKLNHPDVRDMLSQLYQSGEVSDEFKPDYDPGRFRVKAFFNAVYGSTPAEVKTNLVSVRFCGIKVLFNEKNGAAKALTEAGDQLEQFLVKKPELRKYLFPLGGIYKRRTIAHTDRLSPHSWGIALDLNPQRGEYWQWGKTRKGAEILRLRKEYPQEIIKIFEEHGFIWGGKWSHYDLMHFEYRPELILKAQLLSRQSPQRCPLPLNFSTFRPQYQVRQGREFFCRQVFRAIFGPAITSPESPT